MAYRFVTGERVEFSETDMAGIVHFSNFFRYLERAEHGFVRSLGFSIYEQGEGEGKIGWPRVHASCDFKKALWFEEGFEVEMASSVFSGWLILAFWLVVRKFSLYSAIMSLDVSKYDSFIFKLGLKDLMKILKVKNC